MNRFARISLLVVAVGIAQVVGCSSDGPETIPVYGKITFSGRETPRFCRLYFKPVHADITRPSMATPQSDGSYEVKSFQRSNGLLPGTYSVQVSFFDLKPGANPDSETSYAESAYEAGELVVDSGAGEIEHNIEVPATAAKTKR